MKKFIASLFSVFAMKILIGVIFAVFFSLFFATNSFAQSATPQPPRPVFPLNTNSDVEQDFHTYTQTVFIEVLSTATCFVGGVDMINPDKRCLGIDTDTKKIGYVDNNGGLIAVMGGMIGATYNIPVSSSHYGHYLVSNFGITNNSLAAIPVDEGGGSSDTSVGTGIGYRGLMPVLKIWQTFRNLTYLLFVLVFIILGLGIMFRVNIDARTVMTIQNQIPKIVIALILITLSYAIAGFLIDLMYVAIYLVIHIFDSQGLATVTNIDTNPVMALGSVGGINDIAFPAAKGVGGMISSMFEGTFGSFIGMIVMGIIGGFIGSNIPGVGALGGGGVGALIGAGIGLIFGSKVLGLIAGVIAYLIICVAIFSALFRVWFMLIKAYVYIFLDVIMAPFWIVGGILPGSPGGIGPWLRSLAANLSAFPTVIVLFMIGKTIQDQATNTGGNFIPPLIGDPGADSGAAITSLIGLGIILIMPEAVNITKKAFKAPEMKYSSAVGRAIGAGGGFVSSPVKGGWGKLWGTDAHGHDKFLTRKAGEKLGRIGSGLTGGSFDNVVKHKDGQAERRSWFRSKKMTQAEYEAHINGGGTSGQTAKKPGIKSRLSSALGIAKAPPQQPPSGGTEAGHTPDDTSHKEGPLPHGEAAHTSRTAEAAVNDMRDAAGDMKEAASEAKDVVAEVKKANEDDDVTSEGPGGRAGP